MDIEPPLLIEESLDLEGYDELAWLTDIPEPDEAAGSYDVDEALESSTDEEQPSAEWLNWLDVVEEEQTEEPTSTEPTVTAEQEIAEAEAQEEDEQARDVVEAGIPEGEKPEEPVETVTPEISDADPLVEVAERLERIAAALRDGSAGTLLSEPSTDPLAALVAGYALGYARRRGQGSSGE